MYNPASHYRQNSFDSTSTMTDLTMNSNFTQASFSSASSLSSAFSDTASFNVTSHTRKTNNTLTPSPTLHRQYQYQQQQQYQQSSHQHHTNTPEYSSSHGSQTPTSPTSSTYSAANPLTVSPLFQSIPESRNVLGSLSHNYNKNAYRSQTFSSSHSAALKRHNHNLQDITVHSVPEHAVPDNNSSSTSSAAMPAGQLQPPLQFNTPSVQSESSDMESVKSAPKTLKTKSSWRKFKNVFNHHHNNTTTTTTINNNNTNSKNQESPSSPFASTTIAPQPSNVSIYSSASSNNQIHTQLPHMKTSHHQKPSYGLVSRSDDTRLRDSEANRTEYFEAIQLKFLVYCALVSPYHLEYAQEITPSQKVLDEFAGERLRLVQHSNNIPLDSQIATIEMSLRQLREAILTLHPSETVDIFIYSAKVSSLFGNQAAYLPALTQIVSVIHPELGLDEAQFAPVFELYVLHLVHVADAIVEVFDLLGEYTPPQNPLWDLVRAWVEKDYLRWRKYYDGETDLAKKKMMSKGELTMAREALTRIGSSYLGIPIEDLEAALGMNWERIVDDLGCSWRKEGSAIVIKERRK
jgi:hypothetical protein